MSQQTKPTPVPHKFRKLEARWVFTATLTLITPAHLGDGEEGNLVDMEILRDAADGMPLLTGATLAGALRSHLADVCGGYHSDEDPRVSLLFGGRSGDDQGGQSAIIPFDSVASEDSIAEIRDGVSLDPGTGVAQKGAFFNLELLPAGTKFPLRFDVLVPQDAVEAEMLGLFAAAVGGLADHEISIGARKSRGYGRLTATDWRARRFDLNTKEGWTAWIDSDHRNPTATRELLKCITKPGADVTLLREDKRERFIAEVPVRVKGGLLVRGPVGDDSDADTAHLCSGGEPVVPGTGVAGALRARGRYIDSVLPGASARVPQLMGPDKINNRKGKPAASRLRVTENVVAGSVHWLRFTRIKLDRLTQGVVHGAMLEEDVLYGGTFTLRLEIRNPKDPEIGFLLLLVKDLRDGLIPVGGTASVGRGVLQANGDLSCTLNSEAVGPDQFDDFIKTLWPAPEKELSA